MEWQTIFIIFASVFNFSIVIPTQFLTDKEFFAVDPLFDFNGCCLVLVWGMSYLSAAWSYSDVPFLFLVFFVEKAFYVVHWNQMLKRKSEWIQQAGKSGSAESFFKSFGIGDALFGLGFLTIFAIEMRK